MGLAVTKVSSKRRGSTRDSHARKRVTPTLSKEYQAVFENTGKAMVIVEEDATISLANAEFEKLSGYTKEEIDGKKYWTEFVVRDDRKRVKEYHLLRRTDPILAPRCFEFRFLDRQGNVKNIILTIGQIPGTSKSMASLLDVTDRRQAEDTEQRDKKSLADHDAYQTAELIRTNEALQAEIADLKHEVKRLQRNEAHNRMLIDNIDLSINLIDSGYTIVMVNAAATKQTNKPAHELIGKKCFREFEKRDDVCPHCPGVQTMATGKLKEVEAEGVRDDGSRYKVRIQTFPVFGHDRTITGFIEIVEDITERKQAEELLRQEKETFFSILQNAPYGVVLVDGDGNHIYVNPEFTAITGYTLEDIPTKRHWMQKAYPDKKYRQKIEEIRREDSKLGGNKRIISVVCKNGETKDIEFRVTILDDGRTVAMLVDITERKQMVEALRASEQHYRTLFEESLDGICLADAETGIIIDCNKAMADMVYRERADLIGKPQTMLHPPQDDQEKFSHTFKQHLNDKEGQIIETQVITKTGDIREVEIKANAMNFQGRKLLQGVFRDITERKKMEKELQESEERFRMLAEHAPLGISIMAPDRSFEYLNPRFTEIFGYTMEDIPDKDTWFKKAYPNKTYRKKLISTWKQDTEEGVKTGKENPRVFTVRCKNGQDKIIDFRRIDLKDGKQYQIYDDITNRIKAEEALKQSEERYRTLVENVNLGINLIDANHNIIMVNTGQGKHFNKDGSETIGKKCYQEFEKRDAVCQHCPGVQTLTTGQPAEAETVGVRDDGSRFNARLQTFPIFGDDGTVTSFIEVVEDITERKRMEEDLRESEERFRRLIETTKVGVSAIDDKGVIIYANERLSEMWGCPTDQIIRRSTHDFLDKENLKILKEQLAKRRKGSSESYEITWTRKDGRKVPTILSPTPIFDTDGRYKGSYGFITDITERKRMEEQLQRYAADLERSNEEVKNFAYIVSHDLRVPLINLKGYTSELCSALEVIGPAIETTLPHLNEDRRSAVAIALHEDVPEALEFITNSVSRMDSFINSVLMLSRLGRRELKPEPIDMNALVQTSLENLSYQIQKRETTVTVGTLPQVVADRTAMEQIMGNILGNAVKYLDPERPGQIEVTAETDNGEQIFHIRDNGRGIAEEDMHKVFAPFRRAGKQDTQGEGMGLAYVQTLVRRQDGRIWCESELGKGTTFAFTIAQHRAEGKDHVAH